MLKKIREFWSWLSDPYAGLVDNDGDSYQHTDESLKKAQRHARITRVVAKLEDLK